MGAGEQAVRSVAEGGVDDPVSAPVFVVGCPRSGTTWLTYMLCHHPRVAAYQHAKLFEYLWGMKRWWRNKARGSRVSPAGQADARGAAVHKKLLLPEPSVDALCRDFARGVLQDVAGTVPGARVVVDQTPENLARADFIRDLFPAARFLHVVRDPRAVFASFRAAASWAGWEFPRHPVDGARMWREHVEAGVALGDRVPRCRTVRYESLHAQPARELQAILEWLGLETSLESCQQAADACSVEAMRQVKLPDGLVRTGSADGWRTELRPAEVRLIEYVAAELMERFDYARSEPPLSGLPAGIRLSDAVERGLVWLDRRLPLVTRELIRRWKGRQMPWHWPEP